MNIKEIIFQLIKKIFFLNEIERNNKIDVLDGFRGILAITVVIQHTIAHFNLGGDYRAFDGTGYYVGVISFFILSAFLLTYKMFGQMMKSNGSKKEIIFIILKYFIRRFFRIYIPYVVFCVYAKYLNLTYSTKLGLWYDSMYNLLTLKSIGANHLGKHDYKFIAY
jgi:peptidoglycan/LPS O-acetylase OafA/YrhL